MKCIDTTSWKKFQIGSLFTVSRPKARSVLKYDDGSVPFVASGNFNNGIIKWCKPFDDFDFDAGNCITVSPLNGFAFYQKDNFLGRGGAGSAILILRNPNLTELSGLFLSTVIRRALTKYCYADQLNNESIIDEYILLPVNSTNEPDWIFMENYMRNVLKDADITFSILSSI